MLLTGAKKEDFLEWYKVTHSPSHELLLLLSALLITLLEMLTQAQKSISAYYKK